MTQESTHFGAKLDFSNAMSYGDYLHLEEILAAQHPLSPDHNEMLFIVIHQVSELWIKLALHELNAARENVKADTLAPAFKMTSRASRVFEQLIQAWDVLSTMTPSEYSLVRPYLGSASGFQSYQYRMLEFVMGNKNGVLIKPHEHRPELFEILNAELHKPSLYDEAVRLMGRRGLPVAAEVMERDWTQGYTAHLSVQEAWLEVYRDPEHHWDLYQLAEELLDLEDEFRQWRFRHVTTVERVIGFKQGTGGTPGVSYLRKMIDVVLFPRALEFANFVISSGRWAGACPELGWCMATILLVDDDQFNRNGIGLFLRGEGYDVLEAGDEETAWGVFASAAPQPVAAVVDISIPPNARTPSRPSHSFGINLAQQIKAAQPMVGVVLFSAYEDRGNDVFALVQSGTRGLAYKLKGSHPNSLLAAIEDVLAGRVIIDPEVHANRRGLADEMLNRLTPDERQWVEQAVANFEHLTPREREIASRLAASHNTEGIAAALVVSTKTTENYITHVYDKLGLNEMTQVAPHLRKVVVLAKACMIYDLK